MLRFLPWRLCCHLLGAFVCRLFFLMAKTDWSFKFLPNYFWLYRLHDQNIHKNTVRQIKVISETVGKYIPREYWEGFAWHIQPVPKAEDLLAVERILISNLQHFHASKVLRKITRKSFEFWCWSGHFSEIREVFFSLDLALINKLRLISLLLGALPFVLISPILKSTFFSRAVHRLSNLLTRQ